MKKLRTRTDLLTLIPKNSIILEIGVFKGDFAKEILKITRPSELYLVDIWEGRWGSGDKDGNNYVEIGDMEAVYLNLFNQTKDKTNIHVIRAKAVSFLQSCEDNSFDVIYVDGDHTEEAVYNDMVNSFAKIKPGGLLMGHDYHHQIEIAVNRFCHNYNQTIEYVTEDGCPSFCIKVTK
jgi:spermidine synthase